MTKAEQYKQLIADMKLHIEGETDEISVMANVAAMLREEFGFFWVGFYIVRNGLLHLGPFQGSPACYRIRYGKGVCGTAWKAERTQIVADVHTFEGHIACSSLSQSEIVVPVFNDEKEVMAVLDIDSDQLNSFDTVDKEYLEQVCSLMSAVIY